MNSLVRVALALSFSLLGAFSSFAQPGGGNGAIEGVIVDAQTKPVAGATVEIRAIDTGEVRRTVTDARGRFAAIALPVGVYTVDAALAGFTSTRRAGITVTVGRV